MVLLSAHNPRQRSAIAKKLLTPSKESSFGGASKKVWLASQEGKGRGGEGRGGEGISQAACDSSLISRHMT